MYLATTSILILFLLSTNAAPSIPNADSTKLLNGHAAYRSFNLYDLPVVSNHAVKTDLAIVSSAEIDVGQLDGYGGPKATEAEIPKTSDMFVVNAPENSKEQATDSTDFKPIGVVPKFTGSFRTNLNQQTATSQNGRPIINPAAYFLEGADLSKVPKPNCRMIGCDGPMANDEDFMIQQSADLVSSNSQCHQTFVPLNGCTNGKGYPVGMVCTICCDCTAELITELKQSRGYKENYNANVE
ncbi:hypothetical protein M3Y94_00140400 [Aphelenchoides besseyi]|nr:hypothetical protein M3Y94_00140400 [Aphelenchoides besseyi]KAI6237249.1 hypothetical protein M3Y95_00245300 [Aphelenchoides besseyi]